jgi:lysozyme family protein
MTDYVKFQPAYELVNAHEGGYVNDPADRGGETYAGISRRYHPEWKGWQWVDWGTRSGQGFEVTEAIQEVLDGAKLEFYREKYWEGQHLHRLTRDRQELANQLYDASVNNGRRQAALWVQRALKAGGDRAVKVDGELGPATAAGLNAATRWLDVLKMVECQQGVLYMQLALDDRTQTRFIHGWLKRVNPGAA